MNKCVFHQRRREFRALPLCLCSKNHLIRLKRIVCENVWFRKKNLKPAKGIEQRQLISEPKTQSHNPQTLDPKSQAQSFSEMDEVFTEAALYLVHVDGRTGDNHPSILVRLNSRVWARGFRFEG
jgi:hypothetical protein